jgi:hypothetical protein
MIQYIHVQLLQAAAVYNKRTTAMEVAFGLVQDRHVQQVRVQRLTATQSVLQMEYMAERACVQQLVEILTGFHPRQQHPVTSAACLLQCAA